MYKGTYTHINVGKIRSRRVAVEWQHVRSTLNGPRFLLIYKTSLSVYFWHFYSDVIYTDAGFWEQLNPKYVVAFHVHTPLRDVRGFLHLKHARRFSDQMATSFNTSLPIQFQTFTMIKHAWKKACFGIKVPYCRRWGFHLKCCLKTIIWLWYWL